MENKEVCGVIAIDLNRLHEDYGLVYYECENVVAATGGPAIIYRNSVYPLSHTGMSSLTLGAGAVHANLAEWQYGLSSVKFVGMFRERISRYCRGIFPLP